MVKRHRPNPEAPADSVTKAATELAQIMAERSRLNKDLLIGLANAVGSSERIQRKFQSVVLATLAKIEATLTQVQGAQLAQFWSHCSEAQRTANTQAVDERITTISREIAIKMVHHIYGEELEITSRRGRQSWSGWEI